MRSVGTGSAGLASAPLVLLLLLHVSPSQAQSSTCTLSVTASAPNESHSVQNVSATLLQWCTEDSDCAAAFHLVPGRDNQGAFDHLLPSYLPLSDIDAPLRAIACAADRSSALQQLWMPLLLAHRRTQAPLCDLDHEFVFDEETRQQHCVCRPDRPCTQRTNDPTPLYVVYALLAVVAVGVFAIGIKNAMTATKSLSQNVGDSKAGLRALFGAVKG